jgi:hypothetical protein
VFFEENNKERKKTKEKIEEDLNNKPTDLRWPWPNPLGEYSQQRMNDNLRLLAKDALFVSLSLFLIFSWFEWRNPGISSGIFHPGVLFIFFLFSIVVYQLDWIKEKTIDQKKKMTIMAQYGFLISLLLTTLGSLNFSFIQKITFLANIVNFLETNIFYTASLAIFFGFFTFWLERDRIKKEVEDDEEKEKLEEEKRENEFPQKYPKINKIPVLRGIIKWGYKEGWVYSLFLILIIFVFVLIRSQSLDVPWEHTTNYDKIRSQLPGAINAYLNNDFFHEENNFYGFVNNYGLRNYSSFPIYQWILYPFMGLTNNISIFTIIKSIMLFIDTIILVALFVLFKKILKNKKLALIGTAFVSTNIYFQIYFATPVTDRFALLFFIFSIVLLDQRKYFLSYLLAGFSILVKESFFLIVIPFYVTFEVCSAKKRPAMETANRLFVNLPAIILPYFLFQLLIKKLPTTTNFLRIIYILICILTFYAFYLFSKKSFNFKKPKKITLIIFLLILIIFSAGFFYYIVPKAFSLSSNFLTDSQLLFNWRMYRILIYQFASFFGESIWVFLTLGIILMFTIFKKNIFLKSLLVASLTYLIMASKSIAMHQYYRHIFMIIFIVLLLIVLKSFYSIKLKKEASLIFLSIILIVLLDTCRITTNKITAMKKAPSVSGLEEAGLYLRENLEKKVNILYDDYRLYGVTIFNSFHSPCLLNPDLVRSEVKEAGLKKTLEKYNCTYYISIGELDFSNLINYYTQVNYQNKISRTDLISYRTKQDSLDRSFDTRSELDNEFHSTDINEKIKKYNPEQYFELEKIIGDIYIYKLK